MFIVMNYGTLATYRAIRYQIGITFAYFAWFCAYPMCPLEELVKFHKYLIFCVAHKLSTLNESSWWIQWNELSTSNFILSNDRILNHNVVDFGVKHTFPLEELVYIDKFIVDFLCHVYVSEWMCAKLVHNIAWK